MASMAEFGVKRPVPANLLMVALLLGGIVAGLNLRREFFPESDPELVTITMPYPGASPEEVEQALAIKVEDRVLEEEFVDEVTVRINEGIAVMQVKLQDGTDLDRAVDDLELAVDGLQDLPAESETLTVVPLEPRLPAIRVAIAGELDEAVLKEAIRAVRDDLRSLPEVGEVLIDGVRDYEIAVELQPAALVELGLSLPAVAEAVRSAMVDVPGGSVRGAEGTVALRTRGAPEQAGAIGDIVVGADAQGRTVRLSDIATVDEGFVDTQVVSRFNGQPAAVLTVFSVGEQDLVEMAQTVRAYARGARGDPLDMPLVRRLRYGGSVTAYDLGRERAASLPGGAQLHALSDLARFVEGRLDLLIRNALAGASLVFLTLLLLLNWRAAFWVGIGLVIAIAGTLVLMWSINITLNLLTMFGLIVVLGLLVDDAIVVAENIQAHHDRGGEAPVPAAITATEQVLWPVVATVMTSIVAFLPLRFIQGQIGDLIGALPLVVACALLMSLIESLMILPSHMAHSLDRHDRRKPNRLMQAMNRYEKARDRLIEQRITPGFGRLLELALHYRYVSIAAALMVLIGSAGLLAGNRLNFTFLPDDDAETIVVDLQMPIGTPTDRTLDVAAMVEDAAADQPEVLRVSTLAGQSANIDTGAQEAAATHVAQMFIELETLENRTRTSNAVTAAIRESLAGELPDVDLLKFSGISGGPGGADISVRLTGDDNAAVRAAAADLRRLLASYAGVVDIADDNAAGQRELQVTPLPEARAAGLTHLQINQQLRGALFGIEAHNFAQRQEDTDVRVRLAGSTRTDLQAVEDLWIVNDRGESVPLREVARLDVGSTYATIIRTDGRRSLTVSADTVPGLSPEAVVGSLTTAAAGESLSPLDQLAGDHPGVAFGFTGRQEQTADAFSTLPLGFAAACVMIYVILAWLFASYFQPLVVMAAIPFALVGVIWGHLALGFDVTFLSLIGFVALAGIVVNDSLILVQFFNRIRVEKPELSLREALVIAGKARLRAIVLTTITTVLGLTPLILEQSFQARFLIPMGISIACGLISATVIILIVLPCFLVVLDDIKAVLFYLWHGRRRGTEPLAA
jgi:multidrug efflux pump subunit AcrB